MSTSDIVSSVFTEYMQQILNVSAHRSETERIINEMYSKLQDALSIQYYDNVLRFVSSVDIDEVLSTSPPQRKMINNNMCNMKTPEKKKDNVYKK